MRIALDARKLSRTESGIGTYTLNLARALLEADKEVELVLVCNTAGNRGRLQDPRVREISFPFPPVSPYTRYALIGFRGLMLQHGPRSAPSYLRPLKNKDFKDERVTIIGLYAIGKSTTLESNKSLKC